MLCSSLQEILLLESRNLLQTPVKCDSLGQVLDCQPEGAEVWSPQGLGRAAAPDTQLAQSGQIYLQRFAHLELCLLGAREPL